MVDHRNDVARQIKSKLLFYGIPSPFSARHGWTQNYLKWLKGLELRGEALKVCFESLIELYEYLTEQLTKPSNYAGPSFEAGVARLGSG